MIERATREEWKGFKNCISEECRQLKKDCQQLLKQHCPCLMESDLRKQIHQYQLALRSRKFLSKLNKRIRTEIPSAESTTEYYRARPELGEYTMKKELQRIKYTVWTREGKKLTDSSDIFAYYKETAGENDDLLWRCANQSILGDITMAMVSPDSLIRPQLNAGTCVDEVSMVIDYRCINPHVRVECFLNICIPDSKGQRLSLAGALVMVYFCPSRQEIRAHVTNIFPCHSLTHDEVDRAVAEILDFR